MMRIGATIILTLIMAIPVDAPLLRVAKVVPLGFTIASWYGAKYQGRLTASGEPFDRFAATCAHPGLPFGTRLRLYNAATNRFARCRVTDRGPFCEFPGSQWFSCSQRRGLDTSEGVAELLGFREQGLARLEVALLLPD